MVALHSQPSHSRFGVSVVGAPAGNEAGAVSLCGAWRTDALCEGHVSSWYTRAVNLCLLESLDPQTTSVLTQESSYENICVMNTNDPAFINTHHVANDALMHKYVGHFTDSGIGRPMTAAPRPIRRDGWCEDGTGSGEGTIGSGPGWSDVRGYGDGVSAGSGKPSGDGYGYGRGDVRVMIAGYGYGRGVRFGFGSDDATGTDDVYDV